MGGVGLDGLVRMSMCQCSAVTCCSASQPCQAARGRWGSDDRPGSYYRGGRFRYSLYFG